MVPANLSALQATRWVSEVSGEHVSVTDGQGHHPSGIRKWVSKDKMGKT